MHDEDEPRDSALIVRMVWSVAGAMLGVIVLGLLFRSSPPRTDDRSPGHPVRIPLAPCLILRVACDNNVPHITCGEAVP